MIHDQNFHATSSLALAVKKESVVGPLGERLTLESLPSQNARWTARRKAEVVAAVHGGMLEVADACKYYMISLEEFDTWARGIERGGLRALRSTYAQKNRSLMTQPSIDKI